MSIAPGNAGTSLEPKVKNITLDVLDFAALVQFAEENEIALTIVGPEAPLVRESLIFRRRDWPVLARRGPPRSWKAPKLSVKIS